ncbi:hypothetical protein TNIN_460401 [Trichonephila inaurata madagascariensis]|uniref:Uncharacterized protein n=1 Tax=Trichonephila inaurata madagascariensis TaxID=2747483 RepID=A0A8X7C9M0_9ARAC|nr:hypothetical protein TNIN_460401 [Trichonephila inaurata madagascariensis]
MATRCGQLLTPLPGPEIKCLEKGLLTGSDNRMKNGQRIKWTWKLFKRERGYSQVVTAAVTCHFGGSSHGGISFHEKILEKKN